MKKNTVGELFKENVLLEAFLLNSGEAKQIITPSLAHVDGLSFVIAVDTGLRIITANGTTDHVVASSHTFVFANGQFGQGDVGGTFVLANSGAGNNGSYVIATVVNDTTVTTVGAPTGNETFGATVTATLTDLDLQAVPTVQVSNNFVPPGSKFPTLGQIPNAGRWPDITSEFAPAPVSINGEGEQYIQAYPLVCQRGRLTITPSAGAGYVSVYYTAKGNA